MAKGVLVIGAPGSGKSTSGRNLPPEETFIINVQGKPLPFNDEGYTNCNLKGPPELGNVYYTDQPAVIISILQYISANRPEIKYVLIDDYQYCAVNEFMKRVSEKGFDKFNQIGAGIWSVPAMLPTLRDDLMVCFLQHDEVTTDEIGNKSRRAKQMGKLIDQQVGGIEGYFTYVLFTDVFKKDGKIHHTFLTNNEGDITAKTPMGMFDELHIDNDLMLIAEKLIK